MKTVKPAQWGAGLLLALLILFVVNALAATTITSNTTGTIDGYDYELWKDSGNTSMTLNGGGKFSCSWSNINNALFRIGKKFDSTKTYQQLGNITVNYGCNYQPNGNSYLCIYGWTRNPLVEYYIVESWGSWRPPGATSKGTITVDGGTYDVYETTRINQPSIDGTATFQQYWSVRTSKRTSGTVSVTQHFDEWAKKGMTLGKMYECALTVEGYQSSGTADVYTNTITIGGTNPPVTSNPPTTGNNNDPPSSRSAFTTIEAETYNSCSSSTIQTIGTGNGGSGIGYIESGNTVTYSNVDFGSGATSFSARVASEQNSNIQIRIGSANGTLLGTLSNVATGGWDTYQNKTTTINNVTGIHDLVLVFSGPVNVDSFIFSGGNNYSPPVTTNPTPTSTNNNNGGSYSVDYSQNDWGSGATVTVTITNNGSLPINGWNLAWTFPGNQKITNAWNARYTQSGASVIASNQSWNSTIPANGGRVSFGFNISYSGTNAKPTSFTLNGSSSSTPGVTPTQTSGPVVTPTSVVSPSPTTEGKFHCFLLLGQSNMAGWPKAQDSDKVPNPRILALGYDNNQWAVAVPPLHESWQGAIGPGDWFAKTIINRLPPQDTIGLIPCAISGEKIETFMKNIGSKYDWIISRAKLAQQRGGIIEGILFHQGCSNNGQADWPNKVNTLITDIKRDLGLGDIPVLVGELLYSGSCAGHNTLVNQLPSIIKNCHVISASGLSGDPADPWGLHFNHDSQVTLGKRYAEKMIQVLGW
ncbi:MAG TPA: glycoside hydrolase family 11 protein [Bacillota bacterium]